MAALTGSGLYVLFGTTELTTDYRSFGATETGGVIDASAGADTARTYLTTLKDGSATLSAVWQTGAAALWAAVAPTTSGTLRWGESGSHQGSPSHSVVAFVTERRLSGGYADLMMADISWQFSGTVVDSTFPA